MKRLFATLLVVFAVSPAWAQPAPGVSDQPCPPPLTEPAALVELRARLLDPATVTVDREAAGAGEAAQAYRKAQGERARLDPNGLCRYQPANAALTAAPRAVFFGDSLTEYWIEADPAFFAGNGVAARGIAGQVSAQGLVRFRADVIALRPRAVHIMMGTNDIGGLGGATSLAAIQNNIAAMVDIARANKVRVILATVTPAADYPWRKGMAPAAKIVVLNAWIRAYAAREGLVLADYYGVLAAPDGALRSGLSADGVHPNRAGYALMRPIALKALQTALAKR